MTNHLGASSPSVPPKPQEDVDTNAIQKKVEAIYVILTAIAIVTFLGFIATAVSVVGVVSDAWRSKEASYHDLVEKIDRQDNRIDELIRRLPENPIQDDRNRKKL